MTGNTQPHIPFEPVSNLTPREGKMIALNPEVANLKEQEKLPDFRFYSVENAKDSAFAKLRDDQQRAVLEEANVQLHGVELSKTYGNEVKEHPELVNKIMGYYCEKISQDPDRFEAAMNNSLRYQKMGLERFRKEQRLRYSKSVSRRLDANFAATGENQLEKIMETKFPATPNITRVLCHVNNGGGR